MNKPIFPTTFTIGEQVMKQIAVIYYSNQNHAEYVMAQADRQSAGNAFVWGDIKTARMFGKHFAETLQPLHGQTQVPAEREVAQ